MKTVIIQLGNSDDKLTQAEWSAFVLAVRHDVVLKHCRQIYFAGGPGNAERWQNYAIVAECDDCALGALRASLVDMRKVFDQESVALVVGDVEFI